MLAWGQLRVFSTWDDAIQSLDQEAADDNYVRLLRVGSNAVLRSMCKQGSEVLCSDTAYLYLDLSPTCPLFYARYMTEVDSRPNMEIKSPLGPRKDWQSSVAPWIPAVGKEATVTGLGCPVVGVNIEERKVGRKPTQVWIKPGNTVVRNIPDPALSTPAELLAAKAAEQSQHLGSDGGDEDEGENDSPEEESDGIVEGEGEVAESEEEEGDDGDDEGGNKDRPLAEAICPSPSKSSSLSTSSEEDEEDSSSDNDDSSGSSTTSSDEGEADSEDEDENGEGEKSAPPHPAPKARISRHQEHIHMVSTAKKVGARDHPGDPAAAKRAGTATAAKVIMGISSSDDDSSAGDASMQQDPHESRHEMSDVQRLAETQESDENEADKENIPPGRARSGREIVKLSTPQQARSRVPPNHKRKTRPTPRTAEASTARAFMKKPRPARGGRGGRGGRGHHRNK